MRVGDLTVLLVSALLLVSCSPSKPAAPELPEGLSVTAWQLHDYAWLDRDDGGQPDDMISLQRQQAIASNLTSDVLILRGLGSRAACDQLTASLNPPMQAFYIPDAEPMRGIAILSSIPWSASGIHSNLQFRVQGETRTVTCGSVTIDGVQFWNARISHPDEANYESRRNETRLLAQAIRKEIQAGAAVLLSVELHDDLDSPMVRNLADAGLLLLQPADRQGDCWTCRDTQRHSYRMNQMIWASPDLNHWTHSLLDNEAIRTAGICRPQRLQAISPSADPAPGR